MKSINSILTFLLVVLLSSCDFSVGNKDNGEDQADGSFSKLDVSKNFSFSTVGDVNLSEVSSRINPNSNYRINDYANGNISLGVFNGATLKEMSSIDVPLNTNSLSLIPQRSGFGGDISVNAQAANTGAGTPSINGISFTPLAPFNSLGVPDNLLVPGDDIEQQLLDDIDNTIPPGVNINKTPRLITTDNLDTQITDSAEVWITFVHEGAGFTNSLGYYTYDLNNPPASVDDINQFNLVFPNASLSGSGGGLDHGDKVFLGEFSANTGIGWFLVADGWNSDNEDVTVKSADNRLVKYSNPDFNDFVNNLDKRQHTVVLKDNQREVLILSFEDISRDAPFVDHDMNDAIFYATVTPFTAVGNPNLPEPDPCPDSDGDGVSDCSDCFPNDPDRAHKSYFPGENQVGTLMYEDLWPKTGDYDFNDLVVDYNITTITNSDGNVKDLEIDLTLNAVGGLFKKAMALSLPVSSSIIESVTGQQVDANTIFNLSNGVEDFRSTSVVPFFDDAHELLPPPAGEKVTNVLETSTTVTPDTNTYTITFQNDQVTPAELGNHPYDFFIVTQEDRSLEIHLKGKPNVSNQVDGHFGTDDDVSNPAQNTFYTTSSGLPWAMHITNQIPHPFENQDFAEAYPNFTQWAESGGTQNIDWFEPENRVTSLLFQFP